MKILVVSEQFTNGGLETQIYTQYSKMKSEHEFFFAFGKFESQLDLSDAKIYTGFNFSFNSTIKDFCEDVDKLIQIITENNIDIVHVHPFYSLFPAVFAAKLTGRPVIYTIHAFFSINFTNVITDIILLQYILEDVLDKIFSVSKTFLNEISYSTSVEKTVFLPNAIDLDKYKPNKVVPNKNWALISRIDVDKFGEISKIVQAIDKLDINKLSIYGTGSEVEKLETTINNNNLQEKVELMGWNNNLYEELDGKYNGIIGTDRVTMEAIAMGYPTIIIGYEKIFGVVDKEAYKKLKDINFKNKACKGIEINELNKQLQDVYNNNINYDFYQDFRNEFSADIVYKNYENEIKSISNISANSLVVIYNKIKELLTKSLEIDAFYTSREIYNIIKSNINKETISLTLKNTINNYDKYFELLDKNIDLSKSLDLLNSELASMKEDNLTLKNGFEGLKTVSDNMAGEYEKLKTEIEDLKKADNTLEDKINAKFLLKNTLKKINKKFTKNDGGYNQ